MDYCDDSVSVFDLLDMIFSHVVVRIRAYILKTRIMLIQQPNPVMVPAFGRHLINTVNCIHCYQVLLRSCNCPKNYCVSAQKLTRI